MPPEQLVELTHWLVNRETYASVQKKLVERFGIKVSLQTISMFWRTYCADEAQKRDNFIRGVVRSQLEERFRSPKGSESPVAYGPGQSPRD